MTTDKHTDRAHRIAAARAALQRLAAENPQAVQRHHARLAHLAAVAKRERERVETRVLGRPPAPPVLRKPAGMGKAEWKIEKKRLQREAVAAQSLSAKWAHKQGTPETLERACLHDDALTVMERNGSITGEQRDAAAAIANVHRSIEADVAVKVASLEARVDQSRSHQHLIGESVYRVRMHRAYTLWRDQIPAPKALVLDMIVGDAIGYTVAAARYRVHKRKARRLLIEALDRWPACVRDAFRAVTPVEVERMNEPV